MPAPILPSPINAIFIAASISTQCAGAKQISSDWGGSILLPGTQPLQLG
jgi:hypothetical protein